jgi:hypothetical protein
MLFVILNQHTERVVSDLVTICQDPQLEFDFWGPTPVTVDGETALFRGTGIVSYENQSVASTGSNLVREIVDSPAWIGIRGAGTNFQVTKFSGDTLHKRVGCFVKARRTVGLVTLSVGQVVYDATECDGYGVFLSGFDDNVPVYTPSDVILFHELVHALDFVRNNVSEERWVRERRVREYENEYRASRALPLRNIALAATGNESWWCGAQVIDFSDTELDSPPVEMPDSPAETDFISAYPGNLETGCFVATAAYGSALDPAVRFLRRYRDDVASLYSREGARDLSSP